MAYNILNSIEHATVTVNDSVNGVVTLVADSGWEFDYYYGTSATYRIRFYVDYIWTYYTPTATSATEITFSGLPLNFSGDVRLAAQQPLKPSETPLPTYTLTNNIDESGTTASYTVNDNDITITVNGATANFRLSNIVVTYLDANNIQKTVNAVISNDYQTATATITDANLQVDNTFVISGNYKLYANIVNNIDNATVNYTTLSTDINITATAAANCKFFTTPYVTYRDTNGTARTAYLSLNAARTVATLTITDADVNFDIEINGVCQLYVNVVNSISGTTASYQITDNALIVECVGDVATSNYTFIGTPTINFNGYSIDGVVNGNTAIFTVPNVDLNNVYELHGVYDRIVNFVYDVVNCVFADVPTYATRNGIYNFSVTANEYCKFTVAPTLTLRKVSTQTVLNFTISQTETAATLTVDMANYAADFDDLLQITINANAVIDAEYLDKYGAINVYCVTNDNLTAFASKRFFSGDPSNVQLIDLGNYVCSLKRLYVNLSNVPLIPNVLRCGNYNTQIDVTTPLFDVLTLDCGTVDIPQHNGNLTDLNAEISMFLPFIGFVDVPSDICGKTINVNYVCNIVTSNAVANLVCNGVTFAQYDCNISSDLYYKTNETNYAVKTNGKIDFNNYVLKGLTPFVTCKWYADENQKIYNADSRRGVLATFSGYVQCTEISSLNIVAPSKVIEMITNELENGVIL